MCLSKKRPPKNARKKTKINPGNLTPGDIEPATGQVVVRDAPAKIEARIIMYPCLVSYSTRLPLPSSSVERKRSRFVYRTEPSRLDWFAPGLLGGCADNVIHTYQWMEPMDGTTAPASTSCLALCWILFFGLWSWLPWQQLSPAWRCMAARFDFPTSK